jgi:hypothetical protein
MANEITVSTGMQLTNGKLVVPTSSGTFQLDQTTARSTSFVQDIGTSEETITWGDMTPEYVEMINLDPTNYVTFGNVTLNLDGKLSANGGRACFELDTGGVLILKADTSTCKVRITAFNT